MSNHPTEFDSRHVTVYTFQWIISYFTIIAWVVSAATSNADDWKTYRNGNARHGSTHEVVHPESKPRWVFRSAAAPRMSWSTGEGRVIENHLIGNLTKYDDAIHPVIADGKVYFGSSVDHHLHCLDLQTGKEIWSFAADGPIRLAPTLDQGRIYFGSDDGCAYCLSAIDGSLVWKLRAGPADDWLLARGELISRWPVRTGVMVDQGMAYFGAGIFPHEDIFLYAVKADDGAIVWRQDNVSVQDAGRNDLSPQGYLMASQDRLFVPSGRSLPATFDRQTGEFLHKRTHSWRTTAGGVIGGVHALLSDDQLYTSGPHHWLAMNQSKGDVGFGWFAGRQLVVQDDNAYIATGQTIAKLSRLEYAVNSRRRHELEMIVIDATKKLNSAGDEGLVLRKQIDEAQAELKKIAMIGIAWQQAAQGDGSLIATGDHVFLGGDNRVTAYSSETGDQVWETSVEGEASGLVAADKHVLISTSTGCIYSFASTDAPKSTIPSQPKLLAENPYPSDAWSAHYAAKAEQILNEYGSRRGFCLIIGNEEGRLAYELAMRSELQIYAVDSDANRVRSAREILLPTGLYGTRIVIHSFDPAALPYANYFANLIVSDTGFIKGQLPAPPEKWSRHLKPLGGKIVLAKFAGSPEEFTSVENAKGTLEQANVEGPTTVVANERFATLTRGELPGAGNWTHQYGNPANTGVISETRVKSGLGVLWYGDPGPGDMVNRHEGAVGPLSVNGRLFVQGETTILAYDAYNGLFLWKHENPNALRTGVFNNQNPSNLAASDDRLFHFAKDQCFELDSATGQVMRQHRLPKEFDNGQFEWGYIATHQNILFGAATFRKELEAKQRRRGRATDDATDSLFAIDLTTGEHLWTYRGQSISHHTVAIGVDSLYFIDSSITSEQRMELLHSNKSHLQDLSGRELELAEQRARDADVRRAVALDVRTGTPRWSVPVDVTDCSDIGIGGGKLSLLYQDNVLLLGGANANGHYWKQFVAGEFTRRRMVALSAADGRKLWAKDANYKGRPITIGQRVLAEPWSFDLYTGEQQTRKHPITGQEVPWSLMRTGHHCGVLTGCDSGMLMFRSGETSFYDLDADVGVQHFAGHRLGCWINAIPANGLVMIPEASAGCVCQFSIASTIVMEPREPRREWAVYSAVGAKTPVETMLINFGAPGDRKDDNGRVWLSYPRRKAYQETTLDVALDFGLEFSKSGKYQNVSDASTKTIGAEIPWLYTSWAEGLREFTVPLLGPNDSPSKYDIRLHFGNSPDSHHESSVFDIMMQGKTVAENVTLDSGASHQITAFVRDIPSIEIKDELRIEFVAKNGLPSISAIEIRRTEAAQ